MECSFTLCAESLQDVENMLEAYSLQLDYYMAQLGDLSEFIDDFQVILSQLTLDAMFCPYIQRLFGLAVNSPLCSAG